MYGFKEIDVAGLEALKSSGGFVLIDVRTDAEVSRGMIDSAMHMPLHLLPIKKLYKCLECCTLQADFAR